MMIRSPALGALPGVRHAFFTREGGVSTGLYAGLNLGLGSNDDRAAVHENRARAAAALGLGVDRLVTVWQVHSPDAVTVETPWPPDDNPKADALVTDRPDIGLAVASADCGPVLFADAEARVVGAAHSGWKGAFGGVLESTVEAMERLGADRGRIRAVVGPMISAAAYEVGPEFVARFRDAGEDVGRWFAASDRPDHARFDLPAYILHRLTAAGVGHAESLGLCTYADESRFFSYRRMTHRGEPDYGRHLSIIALDPR